MTEKLAFDLQTARTIDEDGRMRVRLCNISKATVNPYFGREIPDFEKLGLVADQTYQLLRDPDELAKSAPTFNGVQLLEIHIPVSAEDPKRERVVGAIGTDAVFEAPYLKASLIIWDATAIAGVDTNQQRELSCGYRYEPDMTPGEYQGVKYDGVMRNIRGNHVALVEDGRAGPDVLVGDSAIKPKKELNMPMKKKAALAALAADFKAKAAEIAPKLAADAALKPMHATYLKLAKDAEAKAEKADEDEMADDDMMDKDDPAYDEDAETEEEKKARMEKRAADKKAKDEAAKEPEKNMKAAMDAAIKKTEADVMAKFRSIRQAETDVRPYVGDVVALDSAETIYRFALDAMNVDHKGVNEVVALQKMLQMQPKPGEYQAPIAMDTSSYASLDKEIPNLSRIVKV